MVPKQNLYCFVLSYYYCGWQAKGISRWRLWNNLAMAVKNIIGPETRLLSWNVRGLNHPVKRNRVFTHITKLTSEVVYLQETHLLNKDHLKLRTAGFTQIYHSNFNSKSRGVAILIHRKVQFIEEAIVKDKNGRYVIVQGKLFNTPVVLANIYTPNWDNVQFFSDLFSLLPNLDTHNLILGGDLNCVLHPVLGRSSSTITTASKSAQCINSFLQTYME